MITLFLAGALGWYRAPWWTAVLLAGFMTLASFALSASREYHSGALPLPATAWALGALIDFAWFLVIAAVAYAVGRLIARRWPPRGT